MFILNQISKREFPNGKSNNLINISIDDSMFIEFINEFSGSFFLNDSLHVFSNNQEENKVNIQSINREISSLYQIFSVSNLFFWGQDIFGNLFYYEKEGIGYFEIETGEKNFLCSNFSEFDTLLETDYEYLTGINYLNDWEFFNNKKLKETDRLCPKIPFIIGGDYTHENLYEKDMFVNWRFNADLAKQIKNIPDGSPVQIEIL